MTTRPPSTGLDGVHYAEKPALSPASHRPRAPRKEPPVSVKYRFKTGDTISGWLPGEALREAAQSKKLTPESRIQQAGRDDWVLAGSIPGLFQVPPPPVPVAAPEPAVRDQESNRHELRAGGRSPETVHHLLHRSVPAVVHIVGPSSDSEEELLVGMLIGVATDGVMVEVTECSTILYLPMARIRFASIPKNFPTSGPAKKSDWIRLHLDSMPTIPQSDNSERVSTPTHATAD